MELVPLGHEFGVEVRDVGLIDAASSDSVYRSIRAALEEHSVLLFREQEVTDDVQAAFSRAFGPLERVKIGIVGAGTFYSRLHNIAADGTLVPETHRQALTARANQLWHTDSSFKATPALASVLSARIVPCALFGLSNEAAADAIVQIISVVDGWKDHFDACDVTGADIDNLPDRRTSARPAPCVHSERLCRAVYAAAPKAVLNRTPT